MSRTRRVGLFLLDFALSMVTLLLAALAIMLVLDVGGVSISYRLTWTGLLALRIAYDAITRSWER